MLITSSFEQNRIFVAGHDSYFSCSPPDLSASSSKRRILSLAGSENHRIF